MKYQPSLVISLTGYNDVTNSYRRRNLPIPLDSPESFEELYDWVENIRSQSFRNKAVKNYFYNSTPLGSLLLFQIRKRLFKTTYEDINFKSSIGKPIEFNEYKSFDLKKSAKTLGSQIQYNIELMHKLSKSYNVEFKSILQPHYDVHPQLLSKQSVAENEYAHFYDQVMKQVSNDDRAYITNWTTVFQDLEVDEMKTIFADDCHFTDKGYKILANKINDLITAQ